MYVRVCVCVHELALALYYYSRYIIENLTTIFKQFRSRRRTGEIGTYITVPRELIINNSNFIQLSAIM